MPQPTRLDQALEDQFIRLFDGKPLIAKWGDFRANFLPNLTSRRFAAGERIFDPTDVPADLFLIGEGTVTQTVSRNGQVWLRQEFGPGQFFGQQALFTGKYEATATAVTAITLYLMPVADLRVGIDRDPGLFDTLMREKLAGRLRRIPLLRSLTDGDLRWLTEVVDERDCAAGKEAPLETEPGIWIVDTGHIEVTGPINRYRQGGGGWGLTSGSFFAATGTAAPGGPPVELTRDAAPWVALTATARLKTHLFYLPARHVKRLRDAFPDVAQRLRQPLDIPAILADVDLFQNLSDIQRQDLAQYCGWEFVPAGQNITTQGSVGHSFVVLVDGAAVISALDERGRLRPRRQLGSGASFGRTSLLEGKQRDATTRAVAAGGPGGRPGLPGSEHLILDRRDLEYAFHKDRQLWNRDVPLVHDYHKVKEEKQAYIWMQEGEKLRRRDRGHIIWLIGPELVVLFAWLGAYRLFTALPDDLHQQLLVAFGLIMALIALPVAAWIANNYFDDYYVLTNRRVTRRDRVLFLYEARIEAPVEMVQDVTVDANFWGRLLDYGNLTIRTAAKVGAIAFTHVPAPDDFKNLILQEKAEALITLRGQQKEQLRRGLMSELRMALPIPERARPLGDDAAIAEQLNWWRRFRARLSKPSQYKPPVPVAKRPKPKWLIDTTRNWPERWRKVVVGAPPPAQPAQAAPQNQIVWRKHWLNLFERAGLPFLVFVGLLVVGLGFRLLDTGFLSFSGDQLTFPWVAALIASAAWLLWQYADYANDVYILTDEKIIDIEAKPLGLLIKRREGSLDKVQAVDFKQVGLAAYIFNYGDVIIRTAAADEGYDFLMVPHPQLVQATVFQRLDALRGKQEVKKTHERQQELIQGLDVYYQLQEEQRIKEQRR